MWQKLVKIFTSPLKRGKTSIPPLLKTGKHKPLHLQTHYFNVDTSNELKKQRTILQNDAAFKDSQIEFESITKASLLVGFTKHTRTILNGIFMYPQSVVDSLKWQEIEKEAQERMIGLAIFSPCQDMMCLRIIPNNASNPISYLIDHRAIKRVEWLRLPPNKLDATS